MADETGRQFDQSFVVLGSPLGADPDLPVALEPGLGSFDVPTRLTESGAMLSPSLRKGWLDPAASELIPVRVGVIAAIPLNPVRPVSWPAFFVPAPSAPRPQAGSPE